MRLCDLLLTLSTEPVTFFKGIMIWKVKIGSECQNGGIPRRARARHQTRQMVFQKDRKQFRVGRRKKDARDKCHVVGLNVWKVSGFMIRM